MKGGDTMIDLETMYNDCALYQRKVPTYEVPLKIQKAVYYLFCMQNELSEVANCIQWKDWKRTQPLTHPQHNEVRGEMVDVLFFFFKLCTVLNIPMEELFDDFYNKLNINYARINEEASKHV